MNRFRKSLPSILLVVCSTLYLLAALRGLGPSGSGVPLMLKMQAAWDSGPGLHAAGSITRESAGTKDTSHFELWRSAQTERKMIVGERSGGAATLTIITPSRAFRRRSGGAEALDPSKDLLFPVPDPDCGESYYRFVHRWLSEGERSVNGHRVIEVIGRTSNAWLTFDLDRGTYLPWRAVIRQTASGRETRWTVLFERYGPLAQTRDLFSIPPSGSH